MTQEVQNLLDFFDRLSKPEQRVISEMLMRINEPNNPLPDDEIVNSFAE